MFCLKHFSNQKSARNIVSVHTSSGKVRYSCKISIRLELSGHIFEKHSHIKFHENPLIGNRYRQTKLIVPFRNFANAPKKACHHHCQATSRPASKLAPVRMVCQRRFSLWTGPAVTCFLFVVKQLNCQDDERVYRNRITDIQTAVPRIRSGLATPTELLRSVNKLNICGSVHHA